MGREINRGFESGQLTRSEEDVPKGGFVALRQDFGQLTNRSHELLTQLERRLTVVLEPEEDMAMTPDQMTELRTASPSSPLIAEVGSMLDELRNINHRVNRLLDRVNV